jgi:hypothetical protein
MGRRRPVVVFLYGGDPDCIILWGHSSGGAHIAESSLPDLAKSSVPLLVTDTELDPDNFQIQVNELTKARKAAGHPVVRLHVLGHSHISEGDAIGTADDSISGPVLKFIKVQATRTAANR